MRARSGLVGVVVVLALAACTQDRESAPAPEAEPSRHVDGLGDCKTTVGREQLKAVLYAISDLGNNVPLMRRLFRKALNGQETLRIPLGKGVGGGHTRVPIDGPFDQAARVAAHARRGLIRAFSEICSDVPG